MMDAGSVWDVIGAEGTPGPEGQADAPPAGPQRAVWGTLRERPLPPARPLAHRPEHDIDLARDALGYPESPFLRRLEARVSELVRLVRRLEYLHGKECAQAHDPIRRALVGMAYYWQEVKRVDAVLAAREQMAQIEAAERAAAAAGQEGDGA